MSCFFARVSRYPPLQMGTGSVDLERRGRAAGAATLRRRGAQGCGRRALKARASTSDSPRLFERSERSERSELCGATADRAPQGSRPAGTTAAVGAENAARPWLCALGVRDEILRFAQDDGAARVTSRRHLMMIRMTAAKGMKRGLTSYGDADFSLFLRKAFIKAMGYPTTR